MKKLISRIKRAEAARIKEIESEAMLAEKEILKDAKQRAAYVCACILNDAKKIAEQERQRIIASADLQASREKAALIDELLEQYISAALENIDDIRKSSAYQEMLNRVTERAIDAIPSQSLRVTVSKEDKKLLKLKNRKDKRIEILEGNCGPGSIVESSDGKVRISNDLSELIREKKAKIKSALAGFLLAEMQVKK